MDAVHDDHALPQPRRYDQACRAGVFGRVPDHAYREGGCLTALSRVNDNDAFVFVCEKLGLVGGGFEAENFKREFDWVMFVEFGVPVFRWGR